VFARDVDVHRHHHHYHREDYINDNNNDDDHIDGGNKSDIMCNYMVLSLQELFELANKVGNDEAGE